MSAEDVDIEELEDDDPDLVKKLRAQIRAQGKRTKIAEEAAVERDQVRRELAFLRVGIPETGPGKLFAKAYDGDLDADAIRTAAIEYGILESKEASADEKAAHERMESASAGAPPGDAAADIARELREIGAMPAHQGEVAMRTFLERHPELVRADVSKW